MPTEPREIIAFVVTRIGDTLMCTPALAALKERWPRARLTVALHPQRRDLLKGLPFVDEAVAWNARFRLAAALHLVRRFDLAVIFAPNRRQIVDALRCAREVATFTDVVPPRRHLTQVARPGEVHIVDAYGSLVEALGAPLGDRRLRFALSPEERAEARIRRAGFDAAPLVALQLHSFPNKAFRDWPLGHFEELVARIRAAHPRAGFLITGDARSTPAARHLAERFGAGIFDLSGLDLRRTAALYELCDLYVGVDTGPTHMAGAVGVPMIVLYHALVPPKYFAPFDHPALRTFAHPDTGSGASETADMADIRPEPVAAAALDLLKELPRP